MSKGRYPNEVKLKALELLQQGFSHGEVMSILDISSRGAIRGWERKFKNGGLEEVYRDERGLKATGRPKIVKGED